MYKSKFTLSDDTEEFEGYTDGSLWNGWANVCFTKEQVTKFLESAPYEYKFFGANEGCNELPYPVLDIYNFSGVEPHIIHSSPIYLEETANFITAYFLDLEFMEVEK